jgi:hypothetical protein
MLVAITLTGILGAVAVALDGGLMLDNRRRIQAAADAAALAAATDLFANYATYGGVDTPGTAATSAQATAAANGYTNGANATVTVNIPPTFVGNPPVSGNYKGKTGYAEVSITFNQARGFSGIFGSGSLPLTARAVACGSVGDVGIMCLDDVVTESAQICGKVSILNGGQIYVNSKGTVTNTEFSGSAGTSIVLSGATLTTGGINVYSTSLLSKVNSSTITYTNGGSLKTFLPQLTDPLANIAEPSPTGTTYGNATSGYSVTTSTTLQPGQYPGGIQIAAGTGSGSGSTASTISVTLAAGNYYLGNSSGAGTFTIASTASVTGTGVMFYNQMGDNFSPFAGAVSISPPTTGTYRGISFWQPRSDPMEIHISGSANVSMPGTWYNIGGSYTTGENGGNSSTGEFDINPATGATFSIGSYICDQAEWFQGTGATGGTLTMNPGTAAPTQRPTLVE